MHQHLGCLRGDDGRQKKRTAIFASNTYTLTISKLGTGSGTVSTADNLINCGADCTENYAAGSLVTLTAKATTGSRFAGWSGSCTGKTATCTVTMDAAKTEKAYFNHAAAALQ